MKTIRKSCFETNSSSMHSITYQKVKDKSHTELVNIKDDVLTITLSEYSEGLILSTPDQKLSYIATWFSGSYALWITDDESLETFNHVVADNFDDLDELNDDDRVDYCSQNLFKDYIELLEQIKEKYHLKGIKFEFDKNVKPIDIGVNWQSKEVLQEYIIYDTRSLYDLVFDPCYIIVVDWDSGDFEDEHGNYDFHGKLELE